MLKLVTNAFASAEIYDLLFSWTDDSASLTQMIFFYNISRNFIF